MRALATIVVAGCGSAAAPVASAPPAPAPAGLGEALPVDVVAAYQESPSDLAVDGDDVYWTSSSTLRRARGGVVEDLRDDVEAFVADHGDVFVQVDGQVTHDGVVVGELAGRHLVADATRIYGASGHRIVAIPRAGGPTEELVADGGEIVDLAVADGVVYWADGGDHGNVPEAECKQPEMQRRRRCQPRPQRYGSIRRLVGGVVETIARDVYYPVAIGVAGDHVYWSTTEGEALYRAPIGGGEVVLGLGGRGGAMAVDATGAVVLTWYGRVIEVPASGQPARVRATDLGHTPEVALTDDAIYVVDPDRESILRYPRGPARLTVMASPRGRFADVVLDGDDLYALDIDASEGRPDRVLRVPRGGGRAEVVGRYGTKGAHLAVAGGEVVVLGHDRLYAGGTSFAFTDDEPSTIAVATDGHDVYWLSRNLGVVTSTPIGRDRRDPVYHSARRISIPMSWPRGTLQVDDGALYVAGETVGDLARVRDGASEIVATDVDDFVKRGDVMVTMGDDGLVVRPAGTVLAPPFDGDVDLALDGRDLWWIRSPRDLGPSQLVRAPLDGSPEEIVAELDGVIVADDDAVYLATGDALLRLAMRP